jgi:hypothetical protein
MYVKKKGGELKMKKMFVVIGIVAMLTLINTAASLKQIKESIVATNLNNPPNKPTVTGPTSGKAGTSYTYTAVTTDPDGDKIFYCFNWGDGNEFCTDLVNSGQSIDASHTWQEKGDYTITVTATDEHGAKSEPATLKVSMPLSLPLPENFRIVKPRNGIYLFGVKIMPFFGQIVIGSITVKVEAPEGVTKVEFMLPMACGCGREIVYVDTSRPFEWNWDKDFDNSKVVDEKFTKVYVKGYDYTNLEEYGDSISIYKVKI